MLTDISSQNLHNNFIISNSSSCPILHQQCQNRPVGKMVMTSRVSLQVVAGWIGNLAIGIVWPEIWLFHLYLMQQYSLSATKQEQLKVIFIAEGKLISDIDSKTISGFMRIMDSTNIATITGQFQKGNCSNATILTLNSASISNIEIRLKEGAVWMGGNNVEEYQIPDCVFQGGYRGYQRWGYGKLNEVEAKGVFVVHSEWKDHLPIGKMIKLPSEPSSSSFQIIDQDSLGWVQTKIIQCKGYFRKKVKKQCGESQSSQISESTRNNIVEESMQYLNQLQNNHRSTNFLSPIQDHPLKWTRFAADDVESARNSKMKFDLCEVYLQYLLHQPQNHRIKPTAVLSIYLLSYLQEKRQKMPVQNSIDRLIQPFINPFHLFGGHWQRIIVPLTLTSTYQKHYSFAVIELPPQQLKCTLYDSANDGWQGEYQDLIRLFLKEESEKAGREWEEQIQFGVGEMPQQFDSVSCGFYMLEGVHHIMKKDRIAFTNEDLAAIKDRILGQLQSFLS